MNRSKPLVALCILGASLMLSACEQSEGPAERAGENIDEAAEQAGEKMDDAADELK